jgi:hypothetical protein
MTRRSLLSVPPPSTPSSAAPPDPGLDAEASELGRWLAQDLRTKGAPSEAPAPELPSVHQKRIVEAEQPDNSSWRVPALRVRGSSLPPDSLAPQEVTAAVAPPPAAPLDLQDEDLAVLPSLAGLPRARQPARALMGVGALLTIALVGGWWWGRGQIVEGESGDAAAAASPHVVGSALPPPPPEMAEEEDELEPAQAPPTSVATKTSGSDTALESKLPEPQRKEALGPRGRRSGDSVARFADLPSPTLSRLSRDEQREARSRDDGVRATVRASSGQK